MSVVALRRPAAQQRVQPGDDLLERERLHDVVVGARLQPRHPVADLVARREDAHRQVVPGRAQAPQHLQPVEVGHRHVEQHHGRVDLLDGGERGTAARGGHHLEPLEPEPGADGPPDARVVVHEQHDRGLPAGVSHS